MDLAPPMTDDDARAAATFDALMRAASEPGTAWPLPGADAALIAEAVIDREVRAFASDATLAARIGAMGAVSVTPDSADYVLAPAKADLAGRLKVGTLADPDQGATLIAPATFGAGTALRLTGPGIPGTRQIALDGIARDFWAARTAAIRYPRGFDIFLHDGASVIGLPRSTHIEVL